MEGLYNVSTNRYRYWKGFSITGSISLLVGAGVSALLLDMAWIAGAVTASLVYYVLKGVLKIDNKI